MIGFKEYLMRDTRFSDKQIPYILQWISRFLESGGDAKRERIADTEIDAFLRNHKNSIEDWQLKQARDALILYRYFLRKQKRIKTDRTPESDAAWRRYATETRNILRLKQRSLRTEVSYLGWLRDFYRFLDGEVPTNIDSAESFLLTS